MIVIINDKTVPLVYFEKVQCFLQDDVVSPVKLTTRRSITLEN